MPEMRFHVRWPDGQQEVCYSPSTVIAHYLAAGRDYPVAEFVKQARLGLEAANDRVRARFGMGCAQAINQLADIERRAAAFSNRPDAMIHIEAIEQ